MFYTIIQTMLIAFVAVISPLLGLFLVIAISGKSLIFDENKRKPFYAFLCVSLVVQAYLGKLPILSIIDATVAVIFMSGAFFYTFLRTMNYLKSIIYVGLMNLGYSLIRNFAFKDFFTSEYAKVFAQNRESFRTMFEMTEEQVQMYLNTLDKLESFMLNYQVAIWTSGAIIMLYLGALLISKNTILKWNHSYVRLPFFFVYVLIAALGLFAVGNQMQIGSNLMLIVASAYLIQGIAIIDFYWGGFFRHSKIMTFLLIMAMLLNIYLVALVVLMGIFDSWFNFRKIKIREE